MKIQVARVDVNEITLLRELHRQAMSCQIMHDSFPRRGFSDAYLIQKEGRIAGYGLVANVHWPQTVHEFYPLPDYRAAALPMFRQLLEVSRATHVLAQTNDRLLTLMLYDCAQNIVSHTILFEDGFRTALSCPSAVFRRGTDADRSALEAQKLDPGSDWLIDCDGTPVATGGLAFHYNPPFCDLYMAVAEPYRQRGFGSFMIQELKRVAYEIGKIPAARCNLTNVASRSTLQKAGMLPCCGLLVGEVEK